MSKKNEVIEAIIASEMKLISWLEGNLSDEVNKAFHHIPLSSDLADVCIYLLHKAYKVEKATHS